MYVNVYMYVFLVLSGAFLSVSRGSYLLLGKACMSSMLSPFSHFLFFSLRFILLHAIYVLYDFNIIKLYLHE